MRIATKDKFNENYCQLGKKCDHVTISESTSEFGARRCPNNIILPFPSSDPEDEGVHYTPRVPCSASLKQRIFSFYPPECVEFDECEVRRIRLLGTWAKLFDAAAPAETRAHRSDGQ
jgi:hypothetical protein